MVAPVDSKVELEVEGETFILRLNFRTLALLEEAGMDPFTGEGFSLSTVRLAMMCMALAIEDHGEMTDAEALAIVVRSNGQFAEKVKELFETFGSAPADPSAEGKAKPTRRRAKTAA
ncbi:hypothetical protein [Novosphingobium sp. 9]|uniref:hypothetical protein n=1 Tax=Novosphingobium sp. 9 TaxID=2025349 RepID=UPI0021B4F908|nr:hypothetical protein [Novosphingobium sp. 9]